MSAKIFILPTESFEERKKKKKSSEIEGTCDLLVKCISRETVIPKQHDTVDNYSIQKHNTPHIRETGPEPITLHLFTTAKGYFAMTSNYAQLIPL